MRSNRIKDVGLSKESWSLCVHLVQNPPLMTEPQMNVMTLRQRGVLHLEDFISRDVALDVAEWESDKP